MYRRFALAAIAVLACNPANQQATLWPGTAAPGDTIAMPLSSNHAAPGQERYDLSSDNITVELDWGTSSRVVDADDGLRVIESWTHPAAVVGSFPWPSAARGWLSVVVFHLPEDVPAPATATVRPLRNGMPIPTGFGAFIESTLEIVDALPTTETLQPEADGLEPPPLLRLVGRAGAGLFDDAWFEAPQSKRIGSMEFELEHAAGLLVTDAYPMSDAAQAVALVRPGSGANRVKIVIVDPDGFTLRDDEANRSDEAGDGPFLDVAFTSGPLVPSAFHVHDLRVTDLDGVPLIDHPGDATSYFTLVARGGAP
jgi:hypothetical protein